MSCLVSGLAGLKEGRRCLKICKQPRGEDKTCVSLEAVDLHPSLDMTTDMATRMNPLSAHVCRILFSTCGLPESLAGFSRQVL
jgi:hypothetical protein